jgi:hypothetical protein
MRRFTVGAAGLLMAWSAAALSAQEETPADAPLEAMTSRAATLKMSWGAEASHPAPELWKTPVLRCSDPTRDETDGAVWLWLDGKRPVAALCLLLYASGKWNYEHIALADDALTVTGRPAWTWQSPASKRVWTTLDDAVPDAERARQSTMRSIARRLDASEARRGETFALRLLERPIYTYAEADRGIVAGSLFAMSYGTNPELLVQIEARKSGDKPQWQIAFARLSAAEIVVLSGQRELWRAEAMKADNPQATYFGVNELPDGE